MISHYIFVTNDIKMCVRTFLSLQSISHLIDERHDVPHSRNIQSYFRFSWLLKLLFQPKVTFSVWKKNYSAWVQLFPVHKKLIHQKALTDSRAYFLGPRSWIEVGSTMRNKLTHLLWASVTLLLLCCSLFLSQNSVD